MGIVSSSAGRVIAGLLVVVAAASGCSNAPDPGTTALAATGRDFGMRLYRAEADRSGADQNVVLATWSVHATLAMLRVGARGATAEELDALVGTGPSDDRLHDAFRSQTEWLVGEHDGTVLRAARAAFVDRRFHLLDSCVATLRSRYGADLLELDFRAAPEPARNAMNAWIAENTEGRIADHFPQHSVGGDTRLVLADTVHLDALWCAPFDPVRTRKAPFHLPSGETATVPLMSQRGPFAHHDGDGFQAVLLPYTGLRLAMLVLLPDSADGLPQLEERLDGALIATVNRSLAMADVHVALPRFELSTAGSLVDVLDRLGLHALFTPDADLSGLSESRGIFVDKVRHSVFLRVDERGTEVAAATTANTIEMGTPPPPDFVFVADHPFVFVIEDMQSGTILLVGRFVSPE